MKRKLLMGSSMVIAIASAFAFNGAKFADVNAEYNKNVAGIPTCTSFLCSTIVTQPACTAPADASAAGVYVQGSGCLTTLSSHKHP